MTILIALSCHSFVGCSDRAFIGLSSKLSLTLLRPHEFCLDGKRLASANGTKEITVWDLDSGHKSALLLSTGDILRLQVSPDGKTIAAACDDGAIRLWDISILR